MGRTRFFIQTDYELTEVRDCQVFLLRLCCRLNLARFSRPRNERLRRLPDVRTRIKLCMGCQNADTMVCAWGGFQHCASETPMSQYQR